MPEKNYIITAHQNPLQLKRLIDRLNDGQSYFFIHVDLKVDITPFKESIVYDNVQFIDKRVDCIWADFSQVVATINLLKAVQKALRPFPTIFISGQDYPIKTIDHLNSFMEKNPVDFIRFVKDPLFQDDPMYNERIDLFKINISNKRNDFILIGPLKYMHRQHIKRFVLKFLSMRVPLSTFKYLFKNRVSPFQTHYKGTNWWCFQYDTIEKIIEYVENNEEVLIEYYKYTLSADEQFFHTIYRHLALDKQHGYLDTMSYFNWNRPVKSLPVTFRVEDLDELLGQPEHKIFARKFDSNIDEGILDEIDIHIHKKRSYE